MAIENQVIGQSIEVEIAYALNTMQILKKIRVPKGTTLEKAVQLSGIMKQFPEIDLNKNRVGIFSKFSNRTTILEHNDRVEIYRSLLIDPKEARRLRVAIKKT
ncbi:MAG: RnfH family protein [Nitrosomonas sp.]|nr:RnfH family protein [Nitrosomonas sp.]